MFTFLSVTFNLFNLAFFFCFSQTSLIKFKFFLVISKIKNCLIFEHTIDRLRQGVKQSCLACTIRSGKDKMMQFTIILCLNLQIALIEKSVNCYLVYVDSHNSNVIFMILPIYKINTSYAKFPKMLTLFIIISGSSNYSESPHFNTGG